jgi:catechol 2,3-dioxygenase-like lactoylglutathione lyase family enzyme
MKLQLTHLRLLVSDYKPTFLFYRDVLELNLDWGDEETGYAEFSTGSIQLAVLKKEFIAQVIPSINQPSSFASQDKTSLIFAVDNVDEVYQRLKDHNGILMAPPTDRPDWGIRTAHFRDPDGNLIEIYTNLGILN